MYKHILKPILFSFNPETAHNLIFKALGIIRHIPFAKQITRSIYCKESPALEKEVFGIKFPNPVGLAGGLDKNGEFYNEMANFGFGFVEIGSLTPKPQDGNPKPRCFRVPKDKAIIKNYTVKDVKLGKAENKKDLQKAMGLPEKADTPIIGLVSRLVSHKGLDLIKGLLDELLYTTDVQVAVLGSGDWQYENFFKEMQAKYPDKLAVTVGFIPALARKVYAGSDLFLMPSKSEPCGLSQMVALRYGSVPIVRETGGLRDSITDSGDGQGNGFTFKTYNAHDMLGAIRRGLDAYWDKANWDVLVERAMNSDFSWGKSANEYIKMYKEVLKG